MRGQFQLIGYNLWVYTDEPKGTSQKGFNFL